MFLTKSGDVGVILEVRGIDYECLDGASIDAFTKRLESALRLFDENYRVYQYLFKRSNPGISYKLYGNPIVDAAIRNRIGLSCEQVGPALFTFRLLRRAL